MEIYEQIIFALAGLLICFFGYKIKKIGFFIIWFLLGYNLTTFLLPAIYSLVPGITEISFYQYLLPVAGGLLLGLIGFTIEKLCVGGIAFLLTIIIGVQYFGSEPNIYLISAIVGAVISAIAIALIKPAIIILTSIAGAYALTTALVYAFEFDKAVFFFPILAVLAALGAIFQFSKNKGLN